MEAVKTSSTGGDPVAITTTIETTAGQGLAAAKDVAFGSLAGIVSKIVEYPFDTIKVRLQAQSGSAGSAHALLYRGPLDCFRQSLQHEGVRGLYRGVSAPMVGAAAETSSLFFSYRIAKNVAQSMYGSSTALPLSALVVCGAASGAFTSLVLTPIELVKCQMQVPAAAASVSASNFGQAPRRPGPLALTRAIYRRHGLAGFWHGQLGTFIRETGGSAAWFGTYEAMLLWFRAERAEKTSRSATTATTTAAAESSDTAPKPSISQQMAAGAIAGVCYNFLFFPADTIKSRMQTQELGSSTAKCTFGRVTSELWQQQGLRGFYRGCGITVARSAPSSALIFTIYELLKDYWS